jgi:amino acid transporter
MEGKFSRILFGDPLTTSDSVHERLSKKKALAVFSSDALSSVAYAPEEILLALVVGGAALLKYTLPVAIGITVLLIIVAISYYQTIHAYPSGGGAYIVAHENLGVWPGLTAAAALLIDYVLTVSVSITAGVGAITSAFPAVLPYRVPIALIAILLITWANLRGVRESGTIFSVPTYGFIGIMVTLIILGIFQLITGSISPLATTLPSKAATGTEVVAFVLLLRAFASGTTALTGVEAISNGIPAFKRPESDNAGKTLVMMTILLAVMFLGTSLLASTLGVVPLARETVVSQIGRAVFGSGLLYLILQAATALILFLAANTSYADFPRLSAILARDRYLPRQLSNLGDRLVFNNGIIALAMAASVLVILFRAETHRLIPLYAVGVFLSFTLSQAGMVRHWNSLRYDGWRWKMVVNAVGMLSTGIVLVVITAGKFTHGAWIVLTLLPIFVWIFYTINQHYISVADQLSLSQMKPTKCKSRTTRKHHKIVVPISSLHRGTLQALQFARSLSKDITAVAVDIEPRTTTRIQELWPEWCGEIPLIIIDSPYRSTIGPLIHYIEQVDGRDPDRGPAVVVLPEFITAKWWHELLHNQTARMIKRALIYRRGESGTDRVVIDVPYHLRY